VSLAELGSNHVHHPHDHGILKTPIGVLQSRIHEAHKLSNIIQESAKKHTKESNLRHEESMKRQMKMEEESKLRDEESRKRQKYADEAATELKDVIRSTDKMLQELYDQIVKQQQEEQILPSS
jgi:hypothetical protein